MFSAAVVVYCFTLYLEPSWFHETIGHLKPYATYDVKKKKFIFFKFK